MSQERLIVVYLLTNPRQVQIKGWLVADGLSPAEADKVLSIRWWDVALDTTVDDPTHGAFSWNIDSDDRRGLVDNMDAANDSPNGEQPYHYYGAETSREDIWAELGLKVADVET